MEALRTPDDRFDGLPDFDYAPNYVDDLPGYEGLRVHYLDEGPRDAAQTFLCLHGQPTWSYLYRKMIPVFLAAGHRVVAPDLLGFGRSDKPINEDAYTFHFHRNMLAALVGRLDLRDITLVCQDWGGILGLTLPPDMPERFARLIVMNTTIADGRSPGEGFDKWRAYNRTQHDLNISRMMMRGREAMTEAEALGYDAPFPDASYKAGVRQFPELVMTSPDMAGVAESLRARAWWKNEWSGPTCMLVGMQDPVLGPAVMAELRETINGCPPPVEIAAGGHFLQEEGAMLAEAALAGLEAWSAARK